MRKKSLKGAALAAMTFGMLFHSISCLNLNGLSRWAGPILYDGALDAAWEFIWDNDQTLDLFEDGN